jgi:hypothetical protein
VNNNIYFAEERLNICTQSLQMFDKVSDDDKTSLRFHELPEQLSRGVYKIGEEIPTRQYFSHGNGIVFEAEDTSSVGLVFKFRMNFSVSTKEKLIISLTFVNLHIKVWEIRINSIVVGQAGSINSDILQQYPDPVLFLIGSAIDILKMICFFSSLHKIFDAMTFMDKRFISFNFDRRTVGDQWIKKFLLEKGKWITTDREFLRVNKIINVVKVADPLFLIPSEFFSS